MGGNALGSFVERKDKVDHQAVVDKVLSFFHKFTEAEEVRYVGNKETFGDADLVVKYNGSFDWMVDEVKLNFSPKAEYRNSNVYSFEVDGHQVDLIFTKSEFYNSALAYFANNDLGNLVGRLAHKFGFKYGHDGLVYVMREGDKVLAELHVSQDQDLVYEFLGYSERKDKFENFEEMFEFVSSSEYFDPDVYLLHNRNHVSRVRDAKRPTYNAFLKWCAEHPEKAKFQFPTKENLRDAFKYGALEKAFSMFKGFKEKYEEVEAVNAELKEQKKFFNGNVVSVLTGLTGKNLGSFMSFCKEDPEFKDKVVSHNCSSWVMKKYLAWSYLNR